MTSTAALSLGCGDSAQAHKNTNTGGHIAMTIEQRLSNLEAQNATFARANRRLRLTVSGLAVLVGVGFLAGMNAADPDEMTLRKLSIVDAKGTERIVLDATDASGEASLAHFDSVGRRRITTSTASARGACVNYSDKNGKVRIAAGTYGNGYASLILTDKDQKARIRYATMPDGSATITRNDVTVEE